MQGKWKQDISVDCPYSLYVPRYPVCIKIEEGKNLYVYIFITILKSLILQSFRISLPNSLNNVDDRNHSIIGDF